MGPFLLLPAVPRSSSSCKTSLFWKHTSSLSKGSGPSQLSSLPRRSYPVHSFKFILAPDGSSKHHSDTATWLLGSSVCLADRHLKFKPKSWFHCLDPPTQTSCFTTSSTPSFLSQSIIISYLRWSQVQNKSRNWSLLLSLVQGNCESLLSPCFPS